MVVHFEIIAFLLVVLVLSVILFFFLDSLPIVFIDISGFVAVIIFWYVCTLFMLALFSRVPVFLISRFGTLVLGFYVEGFFILY